MSFSAVLAVWLKVKPPRESFGGDDRDGISDFDVSTLELGCVKLKGGFNTGSLKALDELEVCSII